jgi:xanthine dehydrogenase accessory factor
MIRVRVISALGSTPRDAGAEMFVGPDRVEGTIGGGQLEYMAIDRARAMLASDEAEARMDIPLGPEIGQCCGGRVVLQLDRHGPTPEDHPDVLVFGAGHVGRALAQALHTLPVNPLLIDQRPEELAQAAPGIETRLTPLPEAEIRAARPGSSVVILTAGGRGTGAARPALCRHDRQRHQACAVQPLCPRTGPGPCALDLPHRRGLHP